MATAEESTDLLTVAEASHILKISTLTVQRWIKQGRLRAYRLGPRKLRVRRMDLAMALRPVQSEGKNAGDESDTTGNVQMTWRPLTEDEKEA